MFRWNSSSWSEPRAPASLITSDWRSSCNFFLFEWTVCVFTAVWLFLRRRFLGFSPDAGRPRLGFFLDGRPRLRWVDFSTNFVSCQSGVQSSSVLEKCRKIKHCQRCRVSPYFGLPTPLPRAKTSDFWLLQLLRTGLTVKNMAYLGPDQAHESRRQRS